MSDIYITYVADDAFRPYGEKTETQLKERLPGLLKIMALAVNPDVVVIACNTASTTALAEIRAALDIPVIGVVPAVKPAAQMSKTKTIAVLGTPGTVKRKYVDKLIADFGNGCQVVLHGSIGLVDLAERKLSGQDINIDDIHVEIKPMFLVEQGEKIDVVVLACTHFPLLMKQLKEAAPQQVRWIDSGAAIARRTASVLNKQTLNKVPDYPQTALLIGGQENVTRVKVFAKFGFAKTVIL
ncbi:MAG: glutamate racemase [Robiginitomaculum sp.]|nr:glutamate racemase [Robiginitomaculum sp.]